MPEDASPSTIRPLVIAAAVAILLLAVVYASSVSSKAAYLTQRNHRILANLGTGVEARINQVAQVFRTVREIEGSGGKVELSSFDLVCFPHVGRHQHGVEPTDVEPRAADGEEHTHQTPKEGHGVTEIHPGEELPEIVNLGGSMEFLHRAAGKEELHARPDPDCFLGWLGDSEVFDHIALLDGSGRSSYQTGRSGGKFREVPAIEVPDGEERKVRMPWEDRFHEPEINLAGSTYRVYGYPLTLDFEERDAGTASGSTGTRRRAEWELVGLVRTDRLWADALRLDSSILSGLVYGLFLAAFSWPFIRLWTLGPSERLRPRLVVLTCLSMGAASGVLTIAVADLSAYRGLQAQVSEELRATAAEIREAFQGELREAVIAARLLEEELAPEAARSCRALGDREIKSVGLMEDIAPVRGGLFENRTDLGYRHLEMIFWMNSDGEQCFKRSVQRHATPLLEVADRGYFRNVRNRALWTLPDDPSQGFALESVHSRNSGETLAVLGLPVQHDGGDAGAFEAVGIGLKFPSLFRPILPPGRHLAVTDGTGRVLFHSRSERAGVEDFLRETEDSPELRAVLFAGADRDLGARYWGRDRQMYATSLAGLPLRLVVYQDKDLLRNLNLEMIASTLALFAIHLALLGLCAGVLVTIGIGRSGSMIDGRHTGRLLRAATVFSAVAAALALVIATLPSRGLALPALVLPVAGLGLGTATLVQGGRGPRLQQVLGVAFGVLGIAVFVAWLGETGAPTGLESGMYVLLGAAILLAVVSRGLPLRSRRLHAVSLASLGTAALAAFAVLPALGFFLAVQEERLDREVRRGQVQLQRSLERRTLQTIEAARRVPGLESHLTDLLCDDRDIHFGAYFSTRYRLFVTKGVGLVACPETPGSGEEALPATIHSEGGGTKGGLEARAAALRSEVSRTVALRLPTNEHLVQALLVAGAPGRWSWQASQRTLRFEFAELSDDEKRPWITSVLPSVTPDLGLETAFAALGALLLVAAGLWLLDRRLLVVGRSATPPACLEDLSPASFRRLLLVHPPGADLGRVRPPAAHYLNLARADGVEHLKRLVETTREGCEDALVCIEGIEAAGRNPALREALRSAVDVLGQQTRLRVLLCSTTDPVPLLGPAGADGPGDTENGGPTSVLSPLDRFRVEWCPDPAGGTAIRRQRFERPLQEAAERLLDARAGLAGLGARWRLRRRLKIVQLECRWTRRLQEVGLALASRSDFAELDPARIPELVRRDAGEHYHALWHAISATQRHVLVQLARGALVNPARRQDAERLASWKLIVPRPTLRPMNRSFSRFVKEVHDAAELTRWEEAGASTLWRELRIPLAILFASLAAFLLVTQREFFDVAIAIVSAAAAGIPTLLRMVDGLRKWLGGLGATRAAAGS